MKLSVGDVVRFEYRDTYDRESGTGVIVEIKDNLYKVALVEHDKDGWWWTNYWSWESENRVEYLNKKVKDLGLNL